MTSAGAREAARSPVTRRFYNAHGDLVRRVQFPGSRLVFYIHRIEWTAGRKDYDWWPRFGSKLFRMACPSLGKALRALRLFDYRMRKQSDLERDP